MKFVIQTNLLSYDVLYKLKDALEDLPHAFVGLIPFSREITSDEPLDGVEYIPYGSTSFISRAYDLGWKGLAFNPSRFTYSQACSNRNDMLNHGQILPAIEAIRMITDEKVFIRPDNDLKLFTGSVFGRDEAVAFLDKLDKDVMVVIAPPQKIVSETRCFVVGKQVIQSALYQRNGKACKEPVQLDGLFQRLIDDMWLPHPNCVMDVAMLESGELKVIEFNCINGSGFYGHDIKQIMYELYNYYT